MDMIAQEAKIISGVRVTVRILKIELDQGLRCPGKMLLEIKQKTQGVFQGAFYRQAPLTLPATGSRD